MSSILFFIAAIGVIAGAIGVVTLANPFYAVLALVGHLLSLAVLFLLLRAEFVAAAQVVVYAGAVMVLYVFVVAYVGGEEQPLDGGPTRRARSRGVDGRRPTAALFAGALLVELMIALLGSGLKAVEGQGAGYTPGPQAFGTPAYIGNLLLTRFLLVFEAASLLLLIAAVGGVVLARRRGGIEEDETPEFDYRPIDLKRPLGTGTMAEGVEGVTLAHARAGAPEQTDGGW
ncbi:MAG TPA: NADH-quinone oxidoreductase subunit J [Solirubrobacteraceae bacterium]|nr:NADH-quinone oxidoreductase subunit J [Solirubrobacteraceae bacterium]